MAKATKTTEKKAAAAAPKKSTAVAVIESEQTALAVANPLFDQFAADAGTGMEGADSSSFQLPFLNIIQSLSPQRQKADAKYIEGAEEGCIFNTVTNELYDGETGIRVIPCGYRKQYNEWIPQDNGGGFVASYATKQEAETNCTPGNEIIDTANHYVLVETATGDFVPAVISMTKSKLTVSRNWMSRMNMVRFTNSRGEKFTPPTYAKIWRLTTVLQKNDKHTWYTFKVEDDGIVEDVTAYVAARAFHDQVLAGRVEANMNAAADTDAAAVQLDDEVGDRPKF